MGTYTAHYSIYKPADSETGYLTAFNTGMDNISTNIYNNASNISTLNTFKSALSAISGLVQGNGSGAFSAFSTSGLIRNCVMNRGTSVMQIVTNITYADITGSSVTYTPPSGATKVFYFFSANMVTGTAAGYGNIQILKNGSLLSNSKKDFGFAAYSQQTLTAMYVIDAWTGAQVVKTQIRAFSEAVPVSLNTTYSYDGAAGQTPVYNHYIIFSI